MGAVMRSSSTWFADTASFFAYLRGRGWRYPLLRFGPFLESMHWGHPPRAGNDNGVRS